MNRFVYAACLSLATATAAFAQAPGLSGSWEGEVTQIGPGTYRGGYAAKMTLNGATGNIDYPGLSCGGELRFYERRGQAFAYRERLTYGVERCINAGLVSVTPLDGGAVRWEWSMDSSASGTLQRSK